MSAKLTHLRSLLTSLTPGIIAVSGGVDSRTLAHLAWGWGLNFTPVHMKGPHMPPAESEAALTWMQAQGKQAVVLEVNPLEHPAVRHTAVDRCYHCKYLMFSTVRAKARELGVEHILEGSQASDATSHRPGRKALAELGIVSPLAQVGLTKPEIRAIARETCLENPEQAARPCLLTRLEYGATAREEDLSRLAKAEEALADLGLVDFRVRLHKDGRVVLQLAQSEKVNEDDALVLLAQGGFPHAHIVCTPTVSGYFDRLRDERGE